MNSHFTAKSLSQNYAGGIQRPEKFEQPSSFGTCRKRLVVLAWALVSIVASRCEGQSSQVTVQLPTFNRFSVTTTVVVPDRGSMVLGGVNRSRRGRNSFGVPLGSGLPGLGNLGTAHVSSAGGLSVSATIIDHREIDRALLAAAARRRGAQFDVLGRPVGDAPELLPATVGNHAATSGGYRTSSLFARSHSVMGTGATAEARRVATYLRRGRQAEADGQLHAAKIFYQRVAKHGNAALKQFAEARLAQIELP